MRLPMFALERMFLAMFLPVIVPTKITNPKQNKQIRQHPSFKHHSTRSQNANKEKMKWQNERADEEEVEEVDMGELNVVKLLEGGCI